VSAEHNKKSVLLDCPPDLSHNNLLRGLDLSFSGLFYPFGFPLRITSNSPAVIDAARQSFGHFRPASGEPPLELEVMINGGDNGPAPLPPMVGTRRNLLSLASDSEHFGSCDFESGYAQLWLSPKVLRDPAAFRYYFLDAFGLSLICERHLAPVHAACVALNASGVLLCGPSTVGKSTLAYACARQGFTYVCDDGSFLVRSESDRIVTGNCHSIRFRPSAAEVFPELSELSAIRRANGKMAIEVPLRSLGLTRTAERCRVDHIVFLNRQPSGPARLGWFSRDRAVAELEAVFVNGRASTIVDQRAALARLMDLEVRELTYSDPDSAVAALEALLLQGEAA
jgi:hypothetical protein